jgi:hypothetical protein
MPKPSVERGEFVIIIGQTTENISVDDVPDADDATIAAVFGDLTNNMAAGTRRDVVKAVAKRLRLPTKTVYEALERAKN